MSGDLLATVVAAARRSSEERERGLSLADLRQAVVDGRRPDGQAFCASLVASGMRIIAECKRRSPSRGVLREVYDPVAIAVAYERHGAAAVSVLTEPTFFDGSLEHLRAIRRQVQLPLLRKDFIVTPYQVVEAAAAGADAILLIVAALGDADLRALGELARECGLATLVEVHDHDELRRALDAGAEVVGVNSRNLRTLAVDPRVLDELGPKIPAHVVAVAESGLKTADDLARLRAAGFRAFLMGERFMTVSDPGAALGALRHSAEALVR
jgi:indole-3-glycerol phosphate synthase